MEAFALFLFKSAIWLSGFALIYYLFLRNERFFILKRIYLISGILISLIFPFFSVHYQVEIPVPEVQTIIVTPVSDPVITSVQQVSYIETPYYKYILLFLYLAGVIFFTFRLLTHLISVYKTIKRAEIDYCGVAKLITTSEFSSSFSFFNYIFINPSLSKSEMEQIMNHELVHVQQKHWFDLLIIELLRLIQWINPFAWIYTGFIRMNHEYMADEQALQRSGHPAIYKVTLLNQMFSSPVISLSNSFNYSINKKRFDMMKKIITSPYRKLKLLLILPVFATILYAFAKPELFDLSSIESVTILKDRESVKLYGGKNESGVILIRTKNKGSEIPSDVNASNLEPLQQAPSENEVSVPTDKIGNFGITKDKYLKIRSADGKTPTVFIDGVETDINSTIIDPETIESINVFKAGMAVGKYGDKGKDDVIEIITKKDGSQSKSDQDEADTSFVVIEEMPEFQGGGKDAVFDWIAQNLRYPAKARKQKIEVFYP